MLPTKKLLEKREVFFDKARQMEDEVCGALSQEEKMQLWGLEQKVLAQLIKMERKEKRQEVNLP